MNNLIYVGFGANKGSPLKQIIDGLNVLKTHNSVTNFTCSSIYSTPPLGPAQANYLNGVCSFNYQRQPDELLALLHSIEKDFGRDRSREERWGPRPLDLDILLFKNKQINTPNLTIPHAGLLERGFVIIPMAEIAPKFIFSNGKNASEMARLHFDTNIKRVFNSKGAPLEDYN